MAYDVAIIGAGPIGLELAAALKSCGQSIIHYDAGPVGATINWYPKQVHFFSSPQRIAICGVPLQTTDQTKATREQYLTYLRSVATMHHLKVETYTRVEHIDQDANDFVLKVNAKGKRWQSRARNVVLAIGDMHNPRLVNVPGEDLPHVSHYFEDPHLHFGRRVLIVGGRNSAVEAAIRCHQAGASVTLCCRGTELDKEGIKYWLLPEIEMLIRTGQVEFLPGLRVVEITPEHVCLQGEEKEEAEKVVADDVLLLTGYVQDKSLFQQLGVKLVGENQAPQVDENTMQTNVRGVYIAGTAAAGTQNTFSLFIENCHVHVEAICQSIAGRKPPFDCRNKTNDAFHQAMKSLPES